MMGVLILSTDSIDRIHLMHRAMILVATLTHFITTKPVPFSKWLLVLASVLLYPADKSGIACPTPLGRNKFYFLLSPSRVDWFSGPPGPSGLICTQAAHSLLSLLSLALELQSVQSSGRPGANEAHNPSLPGRPGTGHIKLCLLVELIKNGSLINFSLS